uniref:MKKS centrosomal shuttling protein n=1 Tax=Paramormyrops kingsleyae TaxID=1676925 RepID=A0A3B3QTV8_9TELE|nr:McKusick-Kaufman/Bardet-Biedl syndromes putative chaperonin [Paramormyrops kingsleyae]
MSRLSQKQPSICTAVPLTDPDVSQKLALLRQVLTSCFGPWGRLKQVHNNVGGAIMTTSTSSVLLKAIQVSHPLLKLLVASILNHTSRFGDGGLFAGILSLCLLENALRLGVDQAVAVGVYNRLLGLCDAYLVRDDCGCKIRVDFSSTQTLLTLAHGLLASKPACALTPAEVKHVALQVTRAFLLTVPCGTRGRDRLGAAVVVPVEGQPPWASAALGGLLVDMPESLHPADLELQGSTLIRLALFSVSLAGDLPEAGDGPLELHGETCLEEAVLEQLLRLADQLVSDGVQLLACQKVVHPVLQHYLRVRGVIVVERLGLAIMEPLVQMTDAQPLATFQAPVPGVSYGQLGGLSLHQCGSRAMLHLLPAGEPATCTLVLCHRNQTALAELKVSCERAGQVLRLMLKEPFALLGGGCTETHLAAFVRHESSSDVTEAVRELGCSRHDYMRVVGAFCHSLESVARALGQDGGVTLTDLCHAHCWGIPAAPPADVPWVELVRSCGCGLMSGHSGLEWNLIGTEYPSFSPALNLGTESLPCVLDSFFAKANALHVAVESANLILDLKYVIQDRN